MKGEALFIPRILRKDMLKRLHLSHLGYDSMFRLARSKLFWIDMNNDILQMARSCEMCEDRKPRNEKEPLNQHNDGKGPWDKVATDIFTIENKIIYLL